MSAIKGLTDKQQAFIMFVSLALIGIGALSVPAGAPWWFGFLLVVLGIIGAALKEIYGSKPPGPVPS